MMKSCFCLTLFQFLTLFVFTAKAKDQQQQRELQDIEVTASTYNTTKINPAYHCSFPCVSNLQVILQPEKLITSLKNTQKDTLQTIRIVSLSEVDVPLYQFKQPRRISDKELPFQLVLVSEIEVPHKINVVQDMTVASDSWFPGYYWSIVVICDCSVHEYRHVGWKFTSLEAPSESFYALTVHANTVQKVKVFGMAAPGWMLSNLKEANKNLTTLNIEVGPS